MSNDKNPLVSIYILCFNHEKYIAESIESVINQTYSNIEIVIVDNASTDNSRIVIDFYAKQDGRIKAFFLEHNTFPSAGSNFAIKQCSGDYICGLSADDCFSEAKIATQLNYMLSRSLSNSFTWVKVVDDDGQELLDHWAHHLFNRDFSRAELLKYFISNGNTLCAITWMFHKSIFDKYGYFDHRLLQTQDFDLWLRISKCEKINVLTEKLTCYRVRNDGNNLSVNMDEKAKLRNWFEATHYMRHVLDFDLSLLSEVSGVRCQEENKHMVMFEYYKNKGIIPYAVAVLYAMHEALGNNFNFPSGFYSDFLDAQSSFPFMCESKCASLGLFFQVYFDYGKGFNEESSQILPVAQTGELQKFMFSVSGLKPLYSIRLDLLNEFCVVNIESINLITNSGSYYVDNTNLVTNAFYCDGNKFYFDKEDPNIVLNFNNSNFAQVQELMIIVRFVEFGSDAVRSCLALCNDRLKRDKKSWFKLLLLKFNNKFKSIFKAS